MSIPCHTHTTFIHHAMLCLYFVMHTLIYSVNTVATRIFCWPGIVSVVRTCTLVAPNSNLSIYCNSAALGSSLASHAYCHVKLECDIVLTWTEEFSPGNISDYWIIFTSSVTSGLCQAIGHLQEGVVQGCGGVCSCLDTSLIRFGPCHHPLRTHDHFQYCQLECLCQ